MISLVRVLCFAFIHFNPSLWWVLSLQSVLFFPAVCFSFGRHTPTKQSFLYRTNPFSPKRVASLSSIGRRTELIQLLQENMSSFSSSSSSFSSAEQVPTNIHKQAQQQEAIWCHEKQIYINGQIPMLGGSSSSSDYNMDLQQLLQIHNGMLYLFGYGSLCWNPGNPEKDTLAMTHLGVTSKMASVQGYKRCWVQKSTDHRGIPTFPGIVCTLFKQEEIEYLKQAQGKENEKYYENSSVKTPFITRGVLFTIPAILVHQVLLELDFREKGGYARDIIHVLDHETGHEVKALLYRGTPDSPAFWYRAYSDLTFAAAVISQAIGPSGPNDIYLKCLGRFLAQQPSMGNRDRGFQDTAHHDTDTETLITLTDFIQNNTNVYFLVASGSNQYNQLAIQDNETSDFKQLTEAVLFVPREDDATAFYEGTCNTTTMSTRKRPKQIYAGGGHSALLTIDGYLYLWGCNKHGQLGREDHGGAYLKGESSYDADILSSVPIVPPLTLNQNVIKVEKVALGHFHTLIIEQETNMLYSFGEDSRGQVTSQRKNTIGSSVYDNARIHFGIDRRRDRFVDIDAGLYHSAAVTMDGFLVTFGDARFGVIATVTDSRECFRWRPKDGSKIVQVACGHRHTVALDEHGRVWTMGENNNAQMGRRCKESSRYHTPFLVDGPLGMKGSRCHRIMCGWSHTIAVVSDSSSYDPMNIFGWGRNDRGQLGLGKASESVIFIPQLLFSISPTGRKLVDAGCGSESTHVIDEDGDIWGCGWNEHGNLGSSSSDENIHQLTIVSGARLVKHPYDSNYGNDNGNGNEVLLAIGGAHMIAMLN